MENVNKLLLIVDPQDDFTSGSLPVPEAAEGMDALTAHARFQNFKYAACVVTVD